MITFAAARNWLIRIGLFLKVCLYAFFTRRYIYINTVEINPIHSTGSIVTYSSQVSYSGRIYEKSSLRTVFYSDTTQYMTFLVEAVKLGEQLLLEHHLLNTALFVNMPGGAMIRLVLNRKYGAWK